MRYVVMSVAEKEQLASLRFWLYVEKTQGCWLWRGTLDQKGYGKTWYNRRMMFAHRRAWELCVGEIPAGLLACHKCDNPPCVNPDHLFLGTHLDNGRDKKEKGRSTYGERNPKMKIRDCEIPQILLDRESGAGLGSIAKRHGVTKTAIRHIVKKRGPRLLQTNPVLFSRTQTSFLEGGSYDAGLPNGSV